MARDRPTGSVSGERGWAWNQWQAQRRSGPTSPDAGAAEPRGPRPSRREDRERPRRGPVRADAHELEDELHRTERRLQSVITRYEHLLTEKHRQLDDETDAGPASGGLRSALSNAVRRLTTR